MVYLGKVGKSLSLVPTVLQLYALCGRMPDWRQETPFLHSRGRRRQIAERFFCVEEEEGV